MHSTRAGTSESTEEYSHRHLTPLAKGSRGWDDWCRLQELYPGPWQLEPPDYSFGWLDEEASDYLKPANTGAVPSAKRELPHLRPGTRIAQAVLVSITPCEAGVMCLLDTGIKEPPQYAVLFLIAEAALVTAQMALAPGDTVIILNGWGGRGPHFYQEPAFLAWDPCTHGIFLHPSMRTSKSSTPRAIDLFAGTGVFTWLVKQFGIATALAVDNDQEA